MVCITQVVMRTSSSNSSSNSASQSTGIRGVNLATEQQQPIRYHCPRFTNQHLCFHMGLLSKPTGVAEEAIAKVAQPAVVFCVCNCPRRRQADILHLRSFLHALLFSAAGRERVRLACCASNSVGQQPHLLGYG
jgi:hypothetical protein